MSFARLQAAGWLVATAAELLISSLASAAPGQQAYLKASNTGAGDFFGRSVAVSGDIVVIGAFYEDSSATGVNGNQNDESSPNAGAAYVFVRSGTSWAQQAYLKASNTDRHPLFYGDFGTSVAVSRDTVVVGAVQDSSSATGVNGNQIDTNAPGAGAAYVFVRIDTDWSQQAYLKASNTGAGDGFGYAVAVSDDTVVVGAPYEDSNATGVNGNQSDNSARGSGAVYVFARSGTSWIQQAYLKASNTGADDKFGASVAVSGDTVVVGAPWEDSNATGVNGNESDDSALYAGAAYVFGRCGTNWTQQAYLKASNAKANYSFGQTVSVSGDTVVVGAPYEGTNGAGAAYVFVGDGTNWTQQAYLKASNAEANDWFGIAVAASGEMIVVGAYVEDSGATGVNGDESDNSAPLAGAAYVFVRTGTNWNQQAYLKASNAEAYDYFGMAVAASYNTVVVGADDEDSNSTGVNGHQSDNSAQGSGAAYIFSGLGVGPRLALVPDGNGGYFVRLTGAPDATYRLQRAANLSGPWDLLATVIDPTFGLFEFHDATPPPGQAFYRTVQP